MLTISCFNTQIYYERKGEGSPLVFLHGLGSSSADWQAQIAHFSLNYDVIAPDFPLHGASGGDISSFSLPHCAEVIEALLDALGVEKAIVVGISMGGMVGMELSIRAPARVASLVVVNALAECRPRKAIEWWMLLSRRFLLKFVSVENIATLMGKKLLPDPSMKVLREEAVSRWSENHRESYIAAFNAVVNWQVLDKLSQITCPLYLISAEHDYTPPSAKKVLAAIYPNGEFSMLAGSHHLAPLEHPDLFNETLSTWLSSRRTL
ncbi:alpha/beta fold hydrolase [Enterovibrio coralii]|uniref:Alpha/beta hydrolase n=1 Tax=Enterovibrio coralii TaxID=294935 RepID=A0A135IAC2_9GAMM|nr:alpha/beta hydrolase [Enterovibrio coralii]KXF82348.1 alpha/beta hydrolase [Enterovibrio coralii]